MTAQVVQEIETLLGSERYGALIEFDEQLPYRLSLAPVQARLAVSQCPLTPTQLDQLAARLCRSRDVNSMEELHHFVAREITNVAGEVLNPAQVAALEALAKELREITALEQSVRK